MSIAEPERRAAGSREAGRAAYTIAEFCLAHRISRSKLYDLWTTGRGPRFTQVGTKRIITNEAAADWRREGEAAAGMNAECVLNCHPDSYKWGKPDDGRSALSLGAEPRHANGALKPRRYVAIGSVLCVLALSANWRDVRLDSGTSRRCRRRARGLASQRDGK